MDTKTAKLFQSASDFDLCNGVFLRIGERYEHRIVANKYRKEERVVMLVWHASGMIDNGGFEYLFEGDFPRDPGFQFTIQAFDEIDCPQAAQAFHEALSLFPGSRVPADLDVRRRLYNGVPEARREEVNQKFWHADWEEAGEFRLRHKLAEYIRAQRSAFTHL